MSIQVLDCTLRDGGYINDWAFGRKTIRSILDKLEKARIDIIECGFLTGMVRDPERSLFGSVSEIAEVLPPPPRQSLYVAMIAIGEKELHPSLLAPCDGNGIGGVRLTFHQEEAGQAIEWAAVLMDKGYRVFMQPVGTVFYTDLELLRLVEKMNALHPYAFYIVDTLGSMYRNQVTHRFHLINENMDPAIHLGFHAHNNLQLAFSNAQVLGKIQTKRTLILDSSVFGMGRGAGNLPTELITQYINKNIASRYDVAMVMDIYDEYIAAIRREYEWGYSVPYHIAASNVCHPNYATYLLQRQTLTMKDIERIIQSIPEEYKVLYDQALIERLYAAYQSRAVDDSEAVREIAALIAGRRLLLLGPGGSLSAEYDAILDFIAVHRPFVITVNFADARFPMDACFVSNHKRLDILRQELRSLHPIPVIVTSNLSREGLPRRNEGRGAEAGGCLFVDYDRYTGPDGSVSDNAGLMLLRLLRRCGATEASLAGFDGFRPSQGGRSPSAGNYYSSELRLEVDEEGAQEKQEQIRGQLRELAKDMKLSFLTRSAYEEGRPQEEVLHGKMRGF